LKPVVVSSYTRAEISKAAFWYESRKEGLGDQFLIDRTIDRIQINPDGYQPVYKAYRRAVLKIFTDWAPWFKIYPDQSLAVACLSGKRHPSLARERASGVIPIKGPEPD
jgi:hypothetical protein